MALGAISMSGCAKEYLWRGLLCSDLGNSRRRVAGLHLAMFKQQRLYALTVLATHRNIESPIPAKPKANEQLIDGRLSQYVQEQVREPEIHGLFAWFQCVARRRTGNYPTGTRLCFSAVNIFHVVADKRIACLSRDVMNPDLEDSTGRDQQNARRFDAVIQVTPDQGQFLAMLARLMGAKNCIEVGVFTGYSALAVALGLPDSGCLVACDRSEASLAVAQRYFKLAGVSHKVDVRLGMAIDSLNELLLQGGAGRYDFAFLDADKRLYPEYYELLLQLVRPGGLVVIDNVLWHGTVADPSVVDRKTQSIRDFNDFLFKDHRIDYNLISIGDGISLCRKR